MCQILLNHLFDNNNEMSLHMAIWWIYFQYWEQFNEKESPDIKNLVSRRSWETFQAETDSEMKCHSVLYIYFNKTVKL